MSDQRLLMEYFFFSYKKYNTCSDHGTHSEHISEKKIEAKE